MRWEVYDQLLFFGGVMEDEKLLCNRARSERVTFFTLGGGSESELPAGKVET